jgi:hypothetical protein
MGSLRHFSFNIFEFMFVLHNKIVANPLFYKSAMFSSAETCLWGGIREADTLPRVQESAVLDESSVRQEFCFGGESRELEEFMLLTTSITRVRLDNQRTCTSPPQLRVSGDGRCQCGYWQSVTLPISLSPPPCRGPFHERQQLLQPRQQARKRDAQFKKHSLATRTLHEHRKDEDSNIE